MIAPLIDLDRLALVSGVEYFGHDLRLSPHTHQLNLSLRVGLFITE